MEILKISIHCRKNKKNELLRLCRRVSEQTCLEPGCQNSGITDCSDGEELIILEQQWEQWSELSAYFNSDHFRALLGAIKLFAQSYEIQINGISREVSE